MKKWKNQRVKEFFHFSTHTIARVHCVFMLCIMTMRLVVHRTHTQAGNSHKYPECIGLKHQCIQNIEHKNARTFWYMCPLSHVHYPGAYVCVCVRLCLCVYCISCIKYMEVSCRTVLCVVYKPFNSNSINNSGSSRSISVCVYTIVTA